MASLPLNFGCLPEEEDAEEKVTVDRRIMPKPRSCLDLSAEEGEK